LRVLINKSCYGNNSTNYRKYRFKFKGVADPSVEKNSNTSINQKLNVSVPVAAAITAYSRIMINEFKNINEYYSHENLHSFFSKYNDIGKRLNINEYSYPKNGRQCFSCGNSYSHQCCIACKRTIANCECVFICGLSNPCQYDKKGDVTQYRKCKYYTSDLNNFNHNCKGIVFENGQIVTFDTQDNRSYHSYNIL